MTRSRSRVHPPWLLGYSVTVAAAVALAAGGCASGPKQPGGPSSSSAAGSKYPRRPATCEVDLYHTAVPGVQAWDDLGIAEASCHISGAATECLRLLKAEACRMGGDILYNVPYDPLRPRDQVLLYRGQVAHTRVHPIKQAEDEDLPPPASPEESAGPVVPLPAAAPPAGTP